MSPKVPFFTVQRIAYLALMTAACVVGRTLFQFIPNVQPMTAIFLLLTLHLGVASGIIVNLLSILITNFYMGMGTWTVFQILSFSGIILLMGLFSSFQFFRNSLFLQIINSVIAGFLYGFMISIFMVYTYGMTNFWAYYLAGISFDALHAIGNAGFYLILSPVFKKLFTQHVLVE